MKKPKKQKPEKLDSKSYSSPLNHVLFVIIICIILGLIVPLIINFCYRCGITWITTEWGAADALSYFGDFSGAVGTIVLGAISIWQNQEIRLENNKSQDRLEKLSIHANELNLINKIIEFESDRLTELNNAFHTFSDSCDTNAVSAILDRSGIAEAESITRVRPDIMQLYSNCDNAYQNAMEKLDLERVPEEATPVVNSIKEFYDFFKKEIIEPILIDDSNKQAKHTKESIISIISNNWFTFKTYRDKFEDSYHLYLSDCYKRLSKTMFEDLTLSEIKTLYLGNLNED